MYNVIHDTFDHTIAHLFLSPPADHLHSTVHHEAKSEVICVYWGVCHISKHTLLYCEKNIFVQLFHNHIT